MNELTKKQKALVDTLVSEGGTIKDAAMIAGYSQGHGETADDDVVWYGCTQSF